MALADDLERIAAAAAAQGEVAAVIAAEPASGRRLYLVALQVDGARRWAVFDDAGTLVDRRDDVRDTASIIAMCELAEDLAGGGDLDELRARLAQVRIVERPPGIEEAEDAALALERTIGAPPRVATPAFLDDVGIATVRLEQALGELSSPFSEAIRGAAGAVDEFVREVERDYVGHLA
jgi:hypothetical protein